jgi:hypothetical protein
MPLNLNIWNTTVTRFPGAEGHGGKVPIIGGGDDGNSKVAMMLMTGQIPVGSVQMAVGLSRTLKL